LSRQGEQGTSNAAKRMNIFQHAFRASVITCNRLHAFILAVIARSAAREES
jgi:hypothetical protein